jgi:hypothetical protein
LKQSVQNCFVWKIAHNLQWFICFTIEWVPFCTINSCLPVDFCLYNL